MPSKIKALPLRLPDDLRAKIRDEAKLLGRTEHAYLIAIVTQRHQIKEFMAFPVAPENPTWTAADFTKADGPEVLTAAEQAAFPKTRKPEVGNPTAPKQVLAQAEAKAAHLATPPKKKRSWNLKDVHLGPIERPPGSMLKTGQKKR